jgi:hypothetical protein
MGLHDNPPAKDLLEAVREFLQEELRPLVEGNSTLRTHVGIALNIIGIVERELNFGAKQELELAQDLASLGVNSEAELAQAIRSGALDSKRDQVLNVLRKITAAKLVVANPKFLELALKEAELAAQKAKKAQAPA